MVVKRRTEGWGSFILSTSETQAVSRDEKTKAYAEALLKGDLSLKIGTLKSKNFGSEKNFLASKVPEYGESF